MVDLVLEQINNSQAEKAYVVAEYYERVKQPNAAKIYYESLVRRWPDTTWGALARDRLAVMGYLAPADAAEGATAPPPEPGTSISDQPARTQ